MMSKVSRVLLVVALLALVVAASAQSGRDRAKMGDGSRARVSVNDHRVESWNRDAVKMGGNTYLPARPFFREIGGDLDKVGSDYRVRRQGRELRFRPGSRTYYYDNVPRYFPGAPFVRSGQLFIPGRSIIETLGGRYYYDDYGDDRYWLGDRNTWMGPGRLDLESPRSGAQIDDERFTIRGEASPRRDVRILVYRQGGGNYRDQLVYSNMLRAESDGDFDTRVTLEDEGLYRIVVQLLNDYGGIEDQDVAIIRRT